MSVGRQIVGTIARVYTYFALFMFLAGVIGGALWALAGYDQDLLFEFLR